MTRFGIALVVIACVGAGSGTTSCKHERGAEPHAKTAGVPQIWFGDVAASTVVDSDVAKRVAVALWRGLSTKASPTAELPAQPTLLFVSVSDGKTPARVALGSGKTMAAAVASAQKLLRAMTPALRPVWLKLDFVTDIRHRQKARIKCGLHGVASARKLGKAQPPGLYAVADKDTRRALRQSAAFVFRTAAFFFDGATLVPLFRDHRRTRAITAPVLLAAARAGGAYLVRMRQNNGRFIYRYDAAHDRIHDDYNLVRHAGTVYSMFQLYRLTKDAALLRAAEQSLGYLLRYIKPFRNTVVLQSKDRVKLGGVALAAVALAEHVRATGDKRHLHTAQQLCAYIKLSQRNNGSFVHSRNYPAGSERNFVSQYYPGEAMLALLRVYSIDNNTAWLDVAEKAARYLITIRDRGKRDADLIHDHWLLYALNELYRERKKPLYRAHAARIVNAIVSSQTTSSSIADHVGSYYKNPRSTPAATRSEGLLAAHSMIKDAGNQQLVKRIRRAVKLGVRFQLHTQITRERAMYLRDPRRSLGGFTRSLTSFEVRIDYVQHNISALILLHQLLVN